MFIGEMNARASFSSAVEALEFLAKPVQPSITVDYATDSSGKVLIVDGNPQFRATARVGDSNCIGDIANTKKKAKQVAALLLLRTHFDVGDFDVGNIYNCRATADSTPQNQLPSSAADSTPQNQEFFSGIVITEPNDEPNDESMTGRSDDINRYQPIPINRYLSSTDMISTDTYQPITTDQLSTNYADSRALSLMDMSDSSNSSSDFSPPCDPFRVNVKARKKSNSSANPIQFRKSNSSADRATADPHASISRRSHKILKTALLGPQTRTSV